MKDLIGNRLISSIVPRETTYQIHDTRTKGFFLRVHPTGKIAYYCQYARGKKIKIGYTDELKPAEARDIALEHIANAKKGKDPAEEKRKQETLLLKDYIEHRYAPWAESNHKNGKKTVDRIKSRFKPFLEKRLNELTEWQLEKWKSARIKSGTSKNTINRDLAALKASLSKAVEWKIIPFHPLATLKPFKIDRKKKIRFLTNDEEVRLRKTFHSRSDKIRQDRENANRWRSERGYQLYPDLKLVRYVDYLEPMVLLCMNTGMRRGELFNLKWEDVSIQSAMLTVEGETAKSGSTRHIPLNTEALNILKAWKKQSDPNGLVFPSKDGKPFDNIKKSWASLLTAAKIKNFRFHDLRHHFASRLVMAGVALNTVRELLGHSDIKMTLRYAHLAPGHKAEAVESLIALNNRI